MLRLDVVRFLLMPSELPSEDIEAAASAVQHAADVRRLHRRRSERGSPQREDDIRIALDRLKEVMVPLRAHIGRFPYGPQTQIGKQNRAAIKATSKAIQSERRKLHKMKAREVT